VLQGKSYIGARRNPLDDLIIRKSIPVKQFKIYLIYYKLVLPVRTHEWCFLFFFFLMLYL